MRFRLVAHDSHRRRATLDCVRSHWRDGTREQILDGIFCGGATAGVAAHTAAKTIVDAMGARGRRRGRADISAESVVEHSSSLAISGIDAEYSRFGKGR